MNALESVCGVIPEITEYNEQSGVLAFELPRMNEENAEKGILDFELPDMTEEENKKAQIIMNVLKQGLNDLAAEYPQNVTLSIKERRK